MTKPVSSEQASSLRISPSSTEGEHVRVHVHEVRLLNIEQPEQSTVEKTEEGLQFTFSNNSTLSLIFDNVEAAHNDVTFLLPDGTHINIADTIIANSFTTASGFDTTANIPLSSQIASTATTTEDQLFHLSDTTTTSKITELSAETIPLSEPALCWPSGCSIGDRLDSHDAGFLFFEPQNADFIPTPSQSAPQSLQIIPQDEQPLSQSNSEAFTTYEGYSILLDSPDALYIPSTPALPEASQAHVDLSSLPIPNTHDVMLSTNLPQYLLPTLNEQEDSLDTLLPHTATTKDQNVTIVELHAGPPLCADHLLTSFTLEDEQTTSLMRTLLTTSNS